MLNEDQVALKAVHEPVQALQQVNLNLVTVTR